MAKSVKVLREDVSPGDFHPRDLTTDCYFIHRKCGQVDLVKGSGMVPVFDFYHDMGILLSKIKHAEGRRNPKFQEPQI